uniref:ABC transporter domain-containing protein n=1 Tax=Rhabditophanes sp. KR3021 TaxID=114890 RepID=A0AC35U3S8_9BILA
MKVQCEIPLTKKYSQKANKDPNLLLQIGTIIAKEANQTTNILQDILDGNFLNNTSKDYGHVLSAPITTQALAIIKNCNVTGKYKLQCPAFDLTGFFAENSKKLKRSRSLTFFQNSVATLFENLIEHTNVTNMMSERIKKFKVQPEKSCSPDIMIDQFPKCRLYKGFDEVTARFKPLLAGKILLTPDIPETREIKKKLDELLKLIFSLIQYIKFFNANKDVIQDALSNSLLKEAAYSIADVYIDIAGLGMFNTKVHKLLVTIFGSPSNRTEGTFTQFIYNYITKNAEELADCMVQDRIVILQNATELEDTAFCLQKYNLYYTGVVFEPPQNGTNFFQYTIRPLSSMIDTDQQIVNQRHMYNPRDEALSDLKYITFGFVWLQELVDKVIIKLSTGKDFDTIGLFLQQEPAPCVPIASSFDVTQNIPFIFVVSFLCPIAILVKSITTEKEFKLTDMMQISGMQPIMHTVSFAIDSLFINLVLGTLAVTMLIAFEIVKDVQFILFLTTVFLFLYASIAQNIFFTRFFNNSNYDKICDDGVQDGVVGVEVSGLVVKYPNGVKGLKGVDMKFYEGYCTVILGSNGCGKSTLNKTLSGMHEPTEGTINVYGMDIRYDLDEIRKSIGFCPQENVLFDYLTIEEHFIFYANFKEISKDVLTQEMNLILDDTGLGFKKHCLAKNLSGGMKRKLCLGLCLIGHTKVIILDEPTAGVDPFQRKAIWELVEKMKISRTVILCTHYLEEAEVLADRVIVMKSGEIKAEGSISFLKKMVARNFKVKIKISTVPSDFFDTENHLIDHFKATKKIKGSYFIYQIPVRKDYSDIMDIITYLDQKIPHTHEEYQIFIADLQRVFLNIARIKEIRIKSTNPYSRRQSAAKVEYTNTNSDSTSIEGDNDLGLMSKKASKSRESSKDLDNDDIPLTLKLTNMASEHRDDVGFNCPEYTKIANPFQLFFIRLRTLIVKRFAIIQKEAISNVIHFLVPILLFLLVQIYIFFQTATLNKLSTSEVIKYNPLTMDVGVGLSSFPIESFLSFNVNNPNKTKGYLQEDTDVLKSMLLSPGMGNICSRAPKKKYPTFAQNKKKLTYHNKIVKNRDNCNVSAANSDNAIAKIIDKESEIKNPFIKKKDYCTCKSSKWNCTSDNFNNKYEYFNIEPGFQFNDYSNVNISEQRINRADLDGRVINGNESKNFEIGGYQFYLKNPNAYTEKQKEEQINGYNALSDTFVQFCKLIDLNLTALNSSIHHNETFITSIDDLAKLLIRNFAKIENGKIWFNNRYWISAPSLFNAYSNARLRQGTKDQNSAILTIKHAMDSYMGEFAKFNKIGLLTGFLVLVLLFTISMIPAGVARVLVYERINLIKQMVTNTGTPRIAYWLANFVVDILTYLLAMGVLFALCSIFSTQFFAYDASTRIASLITFILFGVNFILWIYIIQQVFVEPTKAYIMIGVCSFFLGTTLFVIYIILDKMKSNSDTMRNVTNFSMYLFSLNPQFNLGMVVYKASLYAFYYDIVGTQIGAQDNLKISELDGVFPDLFMWSQTGSHMAFLGFNILCCIFLLSLLEFGYDIFPFIRILRNLHAKYALKRCVSTELVSQSVVDEEDIVDNIDVKNMEKYGVVCRGITKLYGLNHIAVNDISFCAPKGECLGLLGTNGAGKSTTFGLMTEELYPDKGKIYKKNEFGYCPQVHALNECLTPRQVLRAYGSLRGIPSSSLNTIVEWLLEKMNLDTFADKECGSLSGGNKRKVNMSISVIGNPDVILLDEPSSGMDVASQAFMWNLINSLRAEGKTLILCSHSMTEIESVCQKICIMIDGKIREIGSLQYLKEKLGFHYKLMVKMDSTSDSKTDKIKKIVKNSISSSTVESIYNSTIFYTIKWSETVVREITSTVLDLKAKNLITDFNFRPANLDDIFSNVAHDCQARKHKINNS